MSIVLLQPPNVYAKTATTQITIPPLGLAYVAAALQSAGETVAIVDGVGGWIDQFRTVVMAGRNYLAHGATTEQIADAIDPGVRMLGVSCMFSHCWPQTRAIVAALRRRFPAATIVVGGEHASAIPDVVLRESDVDVVVCGEGEATVVALAAALAKGAPLDDVAGIVYRRPDGTIAANAKRPRIADVDAIAPPAWHLIPIENYVRAKRFHGPSLGVSMPMLATRGCPYRCTFCTSPRMWTTKWAARNPEAVVAEMAAYVERYGIDDFHFEDLTFVIRRDWIESFCAAIGRRGWTHVRWQLPGGTRTEAIDYDLARQMYATGCRYVSFAPESGSQRLLNVIEKKMTLPKLKGAVRDSLDAGMKVECFFIVGLPDERWADVWQTLRFAIELAWMGVHGISVATYRALPGTELFEAMLGAGKVAYNDTLYMSVLRSTDLFSATSYNERMSPLALAALRAFAHLTFFALSFALRPVRLWRLLRNRLRGVQETKLDRVVAELLARHGASTV